MDDQQLEDYQHTLALPSTPLADWRQQRVISALSSEGSPVAINLLVEVTTADYSLKVQQLALSALAQLKEPHQLTVYYFLSKQWGKYESLDFDLNLLRTVYETATEKLRQRMGEIARENGRTEFIEVIKNSRQGSRLGQMSKVEWELTIDLLIKNQQWAKLWDLVQIAPPKWSLRLLKQFGSVEWLPYTPNEAVVFSHLCQLAQKCENIPITSNSVSAKLLQPQLIVQTKNGFITDPYTDTFAISPDAKLLAHLGKWRALRVWSLENEQPLHTLDGEPLLAHLGQFEYYSKINTCTFSPDSQNIVYDVGRFVNFFNIIQNRVTLVLDLNGDHNGYSGSRWAFSPNGRWIAVANGSSQLYVWTLPAGKLLTKLQAQHQNEEASEKFATLAVSSDGETLAAGTAKGRIIFWRTSDWQKLHTIEANEDGKGSIEALFFSPDGKIIAKQTESRKYIHFFAVEGQLITKIALFHYIARHIRAMFFNADGQTFTVATTKAVQWWNLANGEMFYQFEEDIGSYLTLNAANLMLVSSNDSATTIWDTRLVRICNYPIAQSSVDDFLWLRQAQQNKNPSIVEQNWLQFMSVLLGWKWRHEIELEDAPERIATIELDIELQA